MAAGTIWTVGHSNKSIDEFVALIAAADIETLVDVRSYPSSKYNPQFNQNPLRRAIEVAGMKYQWAGRNLGGLAGNVRYPETIAALARRAFAGERIAVMCSEGSHLKCHRGDTLAPSFREQGLAVAHLQWDYTTVLQRAPGDVCEEDADDPRPELPVQTQEPLFDWDLPSQRSDKVKGFVAP